VCGGLKCLFPDIPKLRAPRSASPLQAGWPLALPLVAGCRPFSQVMPNVRFPATNKELSPGHLTDGSSTIPTQVYIVLLNDSDTVGENSRTLLANFTAEFGEWEGHRSMFGGKMISGELDQAKVAWLLTNDCGYIKVIEADGQVGFG
jgi:hypothetical protein